MSASYEPGPARGITIGQIVWIPALYPSRDNVVIDIDVASDPTESRLSAFLRPLSTSTNHFPVKSLNLASNEHAFVLKGKMRPAIVLLTDTTQWARSPAENLLVCLPIFSVDKPKFTQGFVLKCQAFDYASKFYLPEDKQSQIEEGVTRLELMQTVHQYTANAFPDEKNPVMLTNDFFALLRFQVTRFLGGVLRDEDEETLALYGQYVREEAVKLGVQI